MDHQIRSCKDNCRLLVYFRGTNQSTGYAQLVGVKPFVHGASMFRNDDLVRFCDEGGGLRRAVGGCGSLGGFSPFDGGHAEVLGRAEKEGHKNLERLSPNYKWPSSTRAGTADHNITQSCRTIWLGKFTTRAFKTLHRSTTLLRVPLSISFTSSPTHTHIHIHATSTLASPLAPNTYGFFCLLQVQFEKGRVSCHFRWHRHICLRFET